MQSIMKRRSVRIFTNDKVPAEHIDKIVRAGMQAPSAHNQQPWEILVVQDKSTLSLLSQSTPYSRMVASSSVCLVLCANSNTFKVADMWQQDMSACAQNILLATTDLELGGVWIGIAPHDQRMKYVSSVINAPDNILPFCLIAIGTPQDANANRFVDRYSASKVHYEKF